MGHSLRIAAGATAAAGSMLVALGAAFGAPPPTTPSVRQYIETIPTVTGATPSLRGRTTTSTTGTSQPAATPAPPRSSVTQPAAALTPNLPRTQTTMHATPSTTSTTASRETASSRHPVNAVVHAGRGSGADRGLGLLALLGGMTIAALALDATRRRRLRRR